MHKTEPIKTDLSKTYLLDLLPIGELYQTKPAKVKLVRGNLHDTMLMATAPGFQKHYFLDYYFQWLLYTGDVKVVEDDADIKLDHIAEQLTLEDISE